MKLPETKPEWDLVKQQFIDIGVEDQPESWTFILSQLQNTKMPDLEFDYTYVFNHYKRWKLAEVLQTEKMGYVEELQAKVEASLQAQREAQALQQQQDAEANGSSSPVSDGPSDPQPEV